MWGQYGDIILVHGDNLFSKTIQGLTHSFFSHAAICGEPGKVAEMSRFGFQYLNNYFANDPIPFVVFRHRLLFSGNPGAIYYIKRMERCLKGFIKNPPKYDYFEILNLAIKLILSREKTLMRNGEPYIPYSLLLLASERLICSALIDTVYYEAGIDLFPDRKSKHTTPADIESLAMGNNPVLFEVYRNRK